MNEPTRFEYSRWRHGGWYVHNVRYASGACGCVSRNYADRKWRIACDPRPFETQPTFKNRDEAARAEWHVAQIDTALVLPENDSETHLDTYSRRQKALREILEAKPELYAQAVERLECLTARLKAAPAPERHSLGARAAWEVQTACRAIEKAATWLETAEGEANL